MAQLFDRAVKLTIGQEPPTGDFVRLMPTALVIQDLRVQFRIEKSLKPEPQKAAIVVYNLSSKSRGLLSGRGLRVILEAGYASTIAQIYAGHTKHTDHPKMNVDWPSKFECGTNERELQYARISESFKAGQGSVSDLVMKCVNVLVTDPGNALQKAQGLVQTFASGYAAHGRASDELNNLLEPRGYSWSIQDGRMQILAPNEYLPDQPIVLSSNTGLIGSPELGSPAFKGGPSIVKLRSLLQPQFKPGGRISLTSQSHSGTFKIVALTHFGDTSGGDWYTDVEALPV